MGEGNSGLVAGDTPSALRVLQPHDRCAASTIAIINGFKLCRDRYRLF
jgi:hypothetical protein